MTTERYSGIAATLLVAGLFVGAACGSDSGDDDEVADTNSTPSVAAATSTEAAATTTEAAATTTEAAATTTTEAQVTPVTSDDAVVGADCSAPVVWDGDAVGPGCFRTDWFSKPFSFTVGESWVPVFAGEPSNANIRLPEVAIAFVLETVATSPDGLAAELAAIEGVELIDETTVEVGGEPGVRYVFSGDYEGVAIATSTGVFTLGGPDEEAVRMTVLEVEGSVMAVVEVTGPDDPDSGWIETAAVIESFTWG